MLGLLRILEPVSALQPFVALSQVGLGGDRLPFLTGLGVHAFLGVLFGLLYAVSQQRIPNRGLIGVGIFYGLALWAAGGLVSPVFGEPMKRVIRSWPWLLASLFYGLCLAVTAVWVQIRRPQVAAVAVQPD